MPDRYGVPTLRDKFPLRCTICKQIITSAKYVDEVLVTAEEDYRVIGVVRDAATATSETPIPVCTYGHVSCIGKQAVS